MLQKFGTFNTSDKGVFGVWCAKCAKYLAFDTSNMDALMIKT